MPSPLVLALCEDDLERDPTFLRAFASGPVNMRVTPMRGPVLAGGTARMVRAQAASAVRAGIILHALLVHLDADTSSADGRRKAIQRWFDSHSLGEQFPSLIACVPAPCTERWLCLATGLRAPPRANPAAGCEPWKKQWRSGRGLDLERVRRAAGRARTTLAGKADFDAFLQDWRAAGLA